MMRSPQLREAFARCQDLTRRHSKSFYFASHLLAQPARDAAYAVYAFCRSADDAVDEAGDSAEQARQNLQVVRRRLAAAYAGQPETLTDQALSAVISELNVERQPFEDLLLGMERDLEPVRFKATGELGLYCYRAAGVVGLLMLPILGASKEEARLPATKLGVAMQITNILRDVGEDLGRGRIYLPLDELTQFGLTHEDIEQRRLDARWIAFMQMQIGRARALYQQAWEGMRFIDTRGGRLCARVMCLVYGDILRSIERNGYDSFSQRARTTTPRKLVLLGRALLGGATGLPALPANALPPMPAGGST